MFCHRPKISGCGPGNWKSRHPRSLWCRLRQTRLRVRSSWTRTKGIDDRPGPCPGSGGCSGGTERGVENKGVHVLSVNLISISMKDLGFITKKKSMQKVVQRVRVVAGGGLSVTTRAESIKLLLLYIGR